MTQWTLTPRPMCQQLNIAVTDAALSSSVMTALLTVLKPLLLIVHKNQGTVKDKVMISNRVITIKWLKMLTDLTTAKPKIPDTARTLQLNKLINSSRTKKEMAVKKYSSI